MRLKDQNIAAKGFVDLTLIDPTTKQVVKRFERVNLVVDRMYLLLARLAANQSIAGISKFAVGSGVGNGTLAAPEAPRADGISLRSETQRYDLAGVTFDDISAEIEGTISDGQYTNRLVFTGVVLGSLSDPNITELGLFGGPSASILTNWVTFPVIEKPDNLDLTFRWTILFGELE